MAKSSLIAAVEAAAGPIEEPVVVVAAEVSEPESEAKKPCKPKKGAEAPAAPVEATVSAEAVKERIAAILSHPAAEGRRALAEKIALATDLSVDKAAELLEVAGKEASAQKTPSVEDRAVGMSAIVGGREPAKASDGWEDVVTELNRKTARASR